MIIYLIALAALCCWGLKFSSFHEDYIGKDQTDALKGVFAMLILFSHIRAHITVNGMADQIYSMIFTRLGQLTVVPFLFYSGYGIFQSVRNKNDYVKNFFKNRILKFLIGYNVVVVVLGVINYCIGNVYPIENYFLSWCGWKTIYGTTGAGVWYIFVILVLYTVTFLALLLFKKYQTSNNQKYLVSVLVFVFVFSVALMAVLWFVKKEENYWYNTLMAYPFGMLYAVLKDPIDRVMKKMWVWLIALVVILIGAGLILISGFKDAISYSIMGYLFILFVTLITMRVRIVNPVLKWLGGLSFGIYIIQRSFMLLFQSFGWNEIPVVYTAICIAATLVASMAHKWLSDKVGDLLKRK